MMSCRLLSVPGTDSTSLVTVPFHGNTLEAVQRDGKVWVSVKRVCESLGIDPWTQVKKLRSHSWATTSMMPVVADDGKLRELAMIQLDSLPMWLAAINAGKVAEEIRPKLTAYQREAAEVLRWYFLGDREATRTTDTMSVPHTLCFRQADKPDLCLGHRRDTSGGSGPLCTMRGIHRRPVY